MGSRGKLLIAGAGALAVLGAALAAVILSSASVTLIVAAQPVRADLQLQGSAQIFHDTSLTTFPTRALSATVTATTTGQATGRRQIPSVAATGEVIFTETPCVEPGAILAGTVVATSGGQQFLTNDNRTIGGGYCTVDAPVTAMTGGAAGNVPAGSIDKIVQIQHPPAATLIVSNPTDTTGGSDARSATFLQQSDVDGARQSLLAQLDGQARAQLKAQAGPLSHLIVSSSPQVTSQLDPPVGTEAATFSLTVDETLTAAAFADPGIHEKLRQAITGRVPHGYALTGDPIKTWFEVTAANQDASVTLSGHGLAYALPVIDARAAGRGIALHTRGAAAALLGSLPDVVGVRIDERPLPLPVLPPLASRISITTLEQSAPR